jgi:hypothetical protein
MKTIELKQHGRSIGTRELGGEIRKSTLLMIRGGDEVLFDFKGIDIISSAFADELFGKLYIELGEEAFKRNVKVNNFDNDDAKKLILLIINKSINFRKNNQ